MLSGLLAVLQSSDLTNPLDISGDGETRIELTKSSHFVTALLCGLARHLYWRVLLHLVERVELHPAINVARGCLVVCKSKPLLHPLSDPDCNAALSG